jgi:hypothetical protein
VPAVENMGVRNDKLMLIEWKEISEETFLIFVPGDRERTNNNIGRRKDFYWEWSGSFFFNFGGHHDCVRITFGLYI